MKKARTITQEQLKQVNDDYIAEFFKNNEEYPKEYIETRKDDFFNTYDFGNNEPSRWAKQLTGYSKNNILLEAWNQYIAMEEAMGEQVWGLTASDSIGERTRMDIVKGFHAYLGGWIEGAEESIAEMEQPQEVR